MIKINKNYEKVWLVDETISRGKKPTVTIFEYENATVKPSIDDPNADYCDISSSRGTRPFCYRKSVFDNEKEALEYKEWLLLRAIEKKKQNIKEGITLIQECLEECGVTNENDVFVSLKYKDISFNDKKLIVSNKYGDTKMNIEDMTDENLLWELLLELRNVDFFVLSTDKTIHKKVRDKFLDCDMYNRIDKVMNKFDGYHFWEA